jgi:hypothetical protein
MYVNYQYVNATVVQNTFVSVFAANPWLVFPLRIIYAPNVSLASNDRREQYPIGTKIGLT